MIPLYQNIHKIIQPIFLLEDKTFIPMLYLLQKNKPAVLTPGTFSYLEEDIDHETYYSCHPAFANSLINGL